MVPALPIFERELTSIELTSRPITRNGGSLAVLAHEGTYPIMYGSWPLPVGTSHRTGYIARPDEAGVFPVVVVVPDLNGLNSFEKDICRTLARSGIATVAINLYGVAGDPLEAYHLLDDARALSDLDEVYEFVMSDDVSWNAGDKVGLLGLDVGGRFALTKAARERWVGSVAVVGTPIVGDDNRDFQVADHLSHLPVPVLGLYGADDDLVDPSTVDDAQSANDHGQWLLYEGAGHGFFDPTTDGYHDAAAGDAMQRLIAFFRATLPAAVVEDLG
jgi:carboxymethylenebutenolidase